MRRLIAVFVMVFQAMTAGAACVPANCDDGDLCTEDRCLLDNCMHIITVLCDDGDACTIDQCNPSTGTCTYTPVPPCNDNNACTIDTCNPASGCIFTPIAPCNDNNACMAHTCNPASGCVFTPIPPCDDNNACTVDTCNPATGCTRASIDCNDNDRCTRDVCDRVTGCRHLPAIACVVASPLTAKMVADDSTTSYKRKSGTGPSGDYVKITLQDVIVTSVDNKLGHAKVSVKATLTGADAGVASLLYPILVLGNGPAGALDTLHAQGYDVDVIATAPPCQGLFATDTCTTLAQQLSKAIDSSLALGDSVELAAFRQGAQAIGYPPNLCDVIQ